MPRFGAPLFLFVIGGLLLACQGDQSVPSEPGRALDLSGACKNEAFTAATAIYVDSQVQSAKQKACKDILGLVSRNKLDQAEIGVNQLLVAIFNDFHGNPAVLQPLPGETLPASVAVYAGAACGLVPFGTGECLTPNDHDDPANGIDEDELDGWMTSDQREGLLPNGTFAYKVEGAVGTVFVSVSQRPRTGVDGPCPGASAHDCEDDVYDVDADGTFTSITVESCNSFGDRHMRCPEGQDCAFGEVANPLDKVTCTEAELAMMGFWGRAAFHATRPAHWIIQATPAYAGVSTRFDAFSPIVAADLDPRRRGVECNIVSSQFNAGSEGSTCRIFRGTTELASCLTVADAGSSNSSSCTLNPLVPEDMTVFVTAEKTGGQGAYNATSAPFTLGPGDPALGETNKEVCFEMSPPSATQVDC